MTNIFTLMDCSCHVFLKKASFRNNILMSTQKLSLNADMNAKANLSVCNEQTLSRTVLYLLHEEEEEEKFIYIPKSRKAHEETIFTTLAKTVQ